MQTGIIRALLATGRAASALCCAAVLFLLLQSGAYAGTTVSVPVTVNVVGGDLQVGAAGAIEFPSVTLDGSDVDAQAAAAPSFTLVDARGTGEGWNLTLQSTDLTDGEKSIDASNFLFNPTGGSITAVKGQSIDVTNGPKESNAGAVSLDTPRKVVTTSQGYGKGKYTYEPASPGFQLHVDASTLTGSYTGTVTATVASGP